jgi:ribosomal protein L11 methyltransferase
MKYHYIFTVKQGSTAEEATEELAAFLTNIYEMDDPQTGAIQIAGYADASAPPPLTHSKLEACALAEEIDWEKQWEAFAPQFHEGLAHIDLKPYGGPILLLSPGAGFGDLSHPTTRLALSLMAPYAHKQTVIDIGCGSGILFIAALLLGAKQAIGIDIDPHALDHARKNAALNHVDTLAAFNLNIDTNQLPNEPFLILINMISSEQTEGWASAAALHGKEAIIIASGILATQRQPYLALTASWGWTLVEEKEEEGWLGFVFFQKKKNPVK